MEINRNPRRAMKGFTLVEMLTVIVIIGILMGLGLSVTKGVLESSRRSRATGEISSFALGLERFETDNGFIPPSTHINKEGNDYSGDAKSDDYRRSSAALFLALTGRQVFVMEDMTKEMKDNIGKNYIELKANQIFTDGHTHDEGAKSWMIETYVNTSCIVNNKGAMKDPWGFPYGYFYDDEPDQRGENSVHNSTSYDLWSTAGNTTDDDKTLLKWVSNWQN